MPSIQFPPGISATLLLQCQVWQAPQNGSRLNKALPTDYKLKNQKLRWFFKAALRGFLPDGILMMLEQWLAAKAPKFKML